MAFEAAFRALDALYRPPLKWQTRLYDRFARGDIPGVCRLPTGLGKTSAIPIWLIALACGACLPLRLVYIVNRRTVVDQATDDAKRLLARLYRSGQQDGLPWATKEAIKELGLESEPSLPSDHAPAMKFLRMALHALCTGDSDPLARARDIGFGHVHASGLSMPHRSAGGSSPTSAATIVRKCSPRRS
ncbi:hypothetical protein J4558_08225 [Leptolyngbya sp. 15MV]|nr:hypothetical protein J4558_08225 [Leptolyngbya sp. 15MV]